MTSRGLMIILDGWGHSDQTDHNAIALARTPVVDRLLQQHPWTFIGAAGEAVGLSAGTPGNSEVGHLTIGAGRVIAYESTRVQRAMESGELQNHPVLLSYLEKAKAKDGAVHLVGLLTNGNVHAHLAHFRPLVEAAAGIGLTRVFLHLFGDARDSANGLAKTFAAQLEAMFQEVGAGAIASIVGRDFGMDRNGKWSKTQTVYDLITRGIGTPVQHVAEALDIAYAAGLADDMVQPSIVVDENGVPIGLLQDNDVLISVNFRGDRMRQVVRSFADAEFAHFPQDVKPNVHVLTLTDYNMEPPVPAIFEQVPLKNGLAETLHRHQVKNLRVSETEKYPHVTFFVDGRVERDYSNQDSIHVPGPKVKDYVESPEMSASGIVEAVRDAIAKNEHQLILVNLVNADILGHTGNLEAVKTAVETVDRSLGEILEAAQAAGYWAVICGDHGNAEVMWDQQLGTPHVGHTDNLVPLIITHPTETFTLRAGGSLADVAPTLLDLLGIDLPSEMTGNSLVENTKPLEV